MGRCFAWRKPPYGRPARGEENSREERRERGEKGYHRVAFSSSTGFVPLGLFVLPKYLVSGYNGAITSVRQPMFFSGVSSVGFSGSRSPAPAALAALRAALASVPAGASVAVGCARGVDAVVRGHFAGSPQLSVFSVASGQWGQGRSAFARRSSACALAVAAGPTGLLVAVPSSPVPPAGVVPRRSFAGCGSGTWGTVAFSLGHGRRVAVWLGSGGAAPCWPGVSWRSVGGGWWLGAVQGAVSAAACSAQLSLL